MERSYLSLGLGFGRVSCKANAAALLAAFDEFGFLSVLPALDEVLPEGRSGFLDMVFISMVGWIGLCVSPVIAARVRHQ